MLHKNGRDEGVEGESDASRGRVRELWNKGEKKRHYWWGRSTGGDWMSPMGVLKERENDRETLDLWDKCWGAGGVSNISHLTQPPPQTRLKWETQTLALWPRNYSVILAFFQARVFFSLYAIASSSCSYSTLGSEDLWLAVIKGHVAVHHSISSQNGFPVCTGCDDGLRSTLMVVI